MAASFTTDEIGKRVVSQRGTQIGTVTDVRDGSLYVTVDSFEDRDAIEELNWEGVVNQDTHELRVQYISSVSENVVRLNV